MAGDEAPALFPVHLVGLPVDVYQRASEHSDELLREFALIREDGPWPRGRRPSASGGGSLDEFVAQIDGLPPRPWPPVMEGRAGG